MLVKLPPGQEARTDPKTGVPVAMKLQRMLDGLAQVSVVWYHATDAALTGVGFALPVSRMSNAVDAQREDRKIVVVSERVDARVCSTTWA